MSNVGVTLPVDNGSAQNREKTLWNMNRRCYAFTFVIHFCFSHWKLNWIDNKIGMSDVITYFMRKSSRDSSAIEPIARYLFINAQIVFPDVFSIKQQFRRKKKIRIKYAFSMWIQSWMSLKWFSTNDLQTLLFRQIFIYATNIFR